MRRASAAHLLCLAVLLPSLAASEGTAQDPATPQAEESAPGSPSLEGTALEDLPPQVLEKLDPEVIAEILAEREATEVVKAVFGDDPASRGLVAIAVPLGFFLTVILVVATVSLVGYRRQRQIQETLRLMIEKGAEIPPELLALPASPHADLRRGLTLAGAGLGLLILIGLTDGFESGSWAVGLIPGFIGAGYLAVWVLSRRSESR